MFAFFCGWTSLFAYSEIVSIPLVLGVILLLNNFFLTRKYIIDLNLKTLFAFLIFVFLSFGFNIIKFPSTKVFNHFLSYNFTVVVYFFSILQNYNSIVVYKTKFLNFISLGVFVTSLLSIFEFCLQYFFNANIDTFLYRPVLADYDAIINEVLGINRSRSTTEESGHFSFYLESLGLISIYHMRTILNSKLLYNVYALVVILGFIFTFSIGGIFSLLVSFIFYHVYFLRKYINIRSVLFTIIIAFVFFLFSFQNIFLEKYYSSSFFDRQERFNIGIEIFNKSSVFGKLFGNGPAAYHSLGIESLINLYQVIMVEIGLVGLFCFICFIFIQVFQALYILRIDKNLGKVYFISVICVFLHFNFIHNYWYPFIWLLFILNTIQYRSYKYGST